MDAVRAQRSLIRLLSPECKRKCKASPSRLLKTLPHSLQAYCRRGGVSPLIVAIKLFGLPTTVTVWGCCWMCWTSICCCCCCCCWAACCWACCWAAAAAAAACCWACCCAWAWDCCCWITVAVLLVTIVVLGALGFNPPWTNRLWAFSSALEAKPSPHARQGNEASPVWVLERVEKIVNNLKKLRRRLTYFMWVAKVRFCKNSRPQIVHECGTRPWSFPWLISWNLRANVAPQSAHAKGFTDPWNLECMSRCSFCAKLSPQSWRRSSIINSSARQALWYSYTYLTNIRPLSSMELAVRH